MRVLLLSAGYGTRLRPLTDTIPKCLVPINEKPLLEIWLDRLTLAGMGPFLVNTHYLAGRVNSFIQESPYRSHVTLVHENELLGTAGTLIANLKFFQGEDGMLVHADNYCLADLDAFVSAHRNRPSGCVMTMMTFRTNIPSSCGIVEIDDRRVAIGFHEKVPHPPGNLANGAVYILSAEMLTEVAQNFSFAKDFSLELMNRFIGRIYTYETKSSFIDVGTPETYQMANRIAEEIAKGQEFQ